MEREYTIGDFTIKAVLEKGSVHIENNEMLWHLLNADRIGNSTILIKMIRQDYEQQEAKELDISDSSLIVEIWGHVYIEYFTRYINDLVKIKPLEILTDKVVRYCSVIDCGESGTDNNRSVWDILSGQMNTIDKLLPEKIDTDILK